MEHANFAVSPSPGHTQGAVLGSSYAIPCVFTLLSLYTSGRFFEQGWFSEFESDASDKDRTPSARPCSRSPDKKKLALHVFNTSIHEEEGILATAGRRRCLRCAAHHPRGLRACVRTQRKARVLRVASKAARALVPI